MLASRSPSVGQQVRMKSAAEKKTVRKVAKSRRRKAAVKTTAAKRARRSIPTAGGRRTGELQVLECVDLGAWLRWLEQHHATTPGVWVKLAKRGSGRPSITAAQAVEGALCWGWIDAQGRSLDAAAWLLKLTPRRARSVWSKINRERALALIESGAMMPPGLAEVERAKQDGRWERAYDSPRNAQVPPDLVAALAKNARARKSFEELDAANRYAILWRLHHAKRAETRANRLATFVAMLARGETLHPRRASANSRKKP
jgi:uncharacterized protein YdeI (YjbR/CyaY-like superfamily)